jgi:hypothetical protein
MQVIAAASPVTRAQRLAVVRTGVASVLLVIVGAILGWACVATPIIGSFMPSGRPSPGETVVAIFAFGFALVVPAGLLILGAAGMLGTAERLATLRPTTVTPRLANVLGPDHLAATDLVLPGGRRVHELVLGPFGIVILGDVPPATLSRHVGNQWEIRGPRGRWVPIEAPLERASRDAERMRGLLATDDRDYVTKVYAAVVTDDPRVGRTAACAVVRPAELGAWLEALPAQRGLTAGRKEHLIELIRSLAVPR